MKKSDKIYFKSICKDLGWEFVMTSKHAKLVHPCGAKVTVSISASCSRYKLNVIRDIKRLLREKNEEDKAICLKA